MVSDLSHDRAGELKELIKVALVRFTVSNLLFRVN